MTLRQRQSEAQMEASIDTSYINYTQCRMYFYGEYNAEDQEERLEKLGKKVADVYTKCIGPNDANIP